MLCQPGIGLGFRHDGQDLHDRFAHVVKYPDLITDAEAVLRVRDPAQPLDAAAAHLGRLVPQVQFEGVTDRGAGVRREAVQVLDRLRGQHDLVGHSG